MVMLLHMLMLLGWVCCELYQSVDSSDFLYQKTTVFERRGMSLQASTIKLDIPFNVMMHGSIFNSVEVNTDGALHFKTFQIQISNTPANALSALVAYQTDMNFTVQYQAWNVDNHQFAHFYVTFFKDGYQKFVLQIPNNSSGTTRLCEAKGCYQSLDTGTKLYSMCSSSKCQTYFQKCTNENDCRQKYPDCYNQGKADCMNEVSFTIAMSVISIAFSCIAIIINLCRCASAIRNCSCECFRCDCDIREMCRCCCPRPQPEVVMPPIQLHIVPPPDAMRVSILQQGKQLTGLHHRLTPDDLDKMVCSICMEVGINLMTICQHYFHWDCLRVWTTKKQQCPYCRHHLTQVFYENCQKCRQFVLPVRDQPTNTRSCTACRQRTEAPSEQLINQ